MSAHAPIPLGSTHDVSMRTSLAAVNDVTFAGNACIGTHSHEGTIFGVMLHGSFRSTIGRRTLDCGIDSAWTEPFGEPHSNLMGRDGARVVVVQANPHHNALHELKDLLQDIHLIRSAQIRSAGLQVSRELQHVDDLTSLTVDALVVQMLVAASRRVFERRHHASPPRWLLQAREMLHASFHAPPTLDCLAHEVGVSTSHLATAFRKFYGVTPGDYVRQARAEWAAGQLRTTSRRVAEIAAAAGYSDQPHFTREMRRVFGVTPGMLRVGVGEA